MDTTNEPLDAIKEWQTWYRSHRIVAEMDEPLVSKDSRENLHDTTNAVNTLPDWREHYKELIKEPMDNTRYKEQATQYFGDTIAEFWHELNGAELFECFLGAAYKNMEDAKAEYERAQKLVDLLRCKNHEN